jgi:toxin-antitoxin system PIN domain toxin
MIVPDINILVHAYNLEAREHKPARAWWERTLGSTAPIGLPWASILGFIRITTLPRLTKRPLYPSEATGHVKEWLAAPNVSILTPGETHAQLVFNFLDELGTAGNLTTDAHLAALAIEYRAELASTDSDFARFRGLRWFNPLEV